MNPKNVNLPPNDGCRDDEHDDQDGGTDGDDGEVLECFLQLDLAVDDEDVVAGLVGRVCRTALLHPRRPWWGRNGEEYGEGTARRQRMNQSPDPPFYLSIYLWCISL